MKKSLAALAAALALAAPARAGIEVSIQHTLDPQLAPPLFGEEHDASVIENIRKRIAAFGLDLSPLGEVKLNLVVSNNRLICDPQTAEEIREYYPQFLPPGYRAKILEAVPCMPQNGFWNPATFELAIAGSFYRGDGLVGFDTVLIHELTHVWYNLHPREAYEFNNRFYAKRAKGWRKLQEQHFKFLVKRAKSCKKTLEKLIEADEKAAKAEEAKKGKPGQPPAAEPAAPEGGPVTQTAAGGLIAPEDMLPPDCMRFFAGVQEAKQVEDIMYRNFGLPSRPAFTTAERDDQHPMEDPSEYLAAIVELLWSNPDAAEREFSAPELQWVRAKVLRGRTPAERQLAVERAVGQAEKAAIRAASVTIPQ